MKLLAIDGNSILNRAFYGIRFLTNSKGFPTNALTGFLNILLKEMDAVKPDCAVAAFDLKAPTFRHKAVESYKATRKGMPDELALQMPKIKEILTAMGIRVTEIEGFEADDILGTCARIFSGEGDECHIVTGDRDSLQLVRGNVTVRLATNKETVVSTPESIRAAYGVSPEQMIEVKALMGDASDNISGVPGIGEKTAYKLIQEFGSVENLYAQLDAADLSAGVKTKLAAGKALAEQSRWLVTIRTDAPVPEMPAFYQLAAPDSAKLQALLAELEMFKLAERLGAAVAAGGVSSATSGIPAEKKPALSDLPVPQVLEPEDVSLLSLNAEAKACFLLFPGETPCAQILSGGKLFTAAGAEAILRFLESPCKKFCFDAKAAHRFALSHGCTVNKLAFSAELAGYLLNSQASEYTIGNLCAAYKVLYRSDCGEFADIVSLEALCLRLAAEIEQTGMEKLLYEIEQPLAEVLASMELLGVRADADGIRTFGAALVADIAAIEAQIHALAGHSFNIASPKQLGAVLFEELGLPAGKKNKSGYSTNAETLEGLAERHAIVPLILEYRTLAKLNSTYVEGLLKVIGADGRVHSIFRQTETRTGRISSIEPNLQNIPVRKELGRNMRKFFVAGEGFTLVDADYSQIELRVLATVSGDETMRAAFGEGKDIHTSTAAQVFGMPEDFVTREMRSAAKAVNFGIIYGIGAYSLSNDIGVSVAQAKQYIKNYLDNFARVGAFMDATVAGGIKNGYVTTLFGRRRYIPELASSNKIMQAFGKRAAMNAPIQGAAADIIKIAMVRVYQRLKTERHNARLILQVHDELILEASPDDIAAVKALLKEEMERAMEFAGAAYAETAVPLTVDIHTGESWYAAKG
ncbi:MAG: DNA polymerase I [Oscillospiraceae bacterium]